MAKEIIVHADAIGARIGNGGFVMLNLLARELVSMGYMVAVFDHLDRLAPRQFDWLDMADGYGKGFFVCPFQYVIEMTTAPIITGWLSALMENGKLLPGLDVERIRYWGGGILRDGKEAERELVIDHMPKIATVNGSLEWCYRKIGYDGEIIHLDNWIRDEFQSDASARQPGLVGSQSDNFVYSIEGNLRDMGLDVQVCEGSQLAVASAMRKCDYFVQWNRHYDCFEEVGLIGETFGMSLFEAMASGCIPIARWHQGIHFASGKIPMVHKLTDIKPLIDAYESDQRVKVDVRRTATEFINREYRFDDRRRQALERLLE